MQDYEALKRDIAGWLMRDDDPALEAVIPSLIRMAEAEFDRRLRVPQMVVRADATLESEFLGVPGDYLETKSLYLTGSSQPLSFTPVDRIRAETATLSLPKAFTVVGDQFLVLPAVSEPTLLEIIYYARIPKLSAQKPTSWLLALAPDLYLYAALAHAAPFLMDDERIPVWQQGKESALEGLNQQAQNAEFSGRLTVKARAL